jgi:2-polyprenyl-3-methyl-5-hydroxy-6-metoxy-1,4-benzoquinol methylase
MGNKQRLEATAVAYHANAGVPDIHIEHIYQEYFNFWLCKQIPDRARVLEMGYGDGIVTAALVDAGFDITVLEGAATLAERARASHPSLSVVNTLFEDFAPSKAFDVVVASHVLEHVDDPTAVLRLIATWLADNGRLIAAVPNANSLHRQLAVMLGLQPSLDALSKRDLMVGHQRVYSLAGLEADMRNAGFDVIESAGFMLKVVPNSMMLQYSHELLRALNAISPRVPKDLLANLAVIAVKCRE